MHHEDECEPALPGKDFLADDESNAHHANKRTLAVRRLPITYDSRLHLNTWCHARRTSSEV